jgi:DNA-directed RNA polymerase specialized sigma24 family protein
VAEVRPDLHRYCARMTGSVADGEDIVQETLARAYYALAEVEAMPPLRPWLFQIATTARSISFGVTTVVWVGRSTSRATLRRPKPTIPKTRSRREEATRAAISRFSELVPVQRSSVILKDVLGHSVEEIAELLELSVPAVKGGPAPRPRAPADACRVGPARSDGAGASHVAGHRPLRRALQRARVGYRAGDARRGCAPRPRVAPPAQRPSRCIRVFHQLRSCRRLVSRSCVARRHRGRRRVPQPRRHAPDFVELTTRDGFIVHIKDYRYVPYILDDALPTIAT